MTTSILDRLQIVPIEVNDNKKKKYSDSRKKSHVAQLGNILGLIFWLYAVLHVLVFDVDKYIASILPVEAYFLVTYKVFVFMILVSIFALFARNFTLLILYIIFFPIIIFFWRIPILIYSFKSWLVVIGLIEFIISLFDRFRLKILTISSTLIGFLFVAKSNNHYVLSITITLLGLLLLNSIVQSIISSFKASAFFKSQANLVSKFRTSEFTMGLIFLDDKLKKNRKAKLSPEDSNSVLLKIQMALMLHRGIGYWAYQLEKYRTSKAGYLLNISTYLSLYFKVVLYTTFINYGLYKINPLYFSNPNSSFIVVLNYSLNSLIFNETTQMLAVADIAIMIRIITGIVGTIILGILVINLLVTTRQSKEDDLLTLSIKSISKERKALEKQIQSEYAVSTTEALDKVTQLKGGLLSIIFALSSEIPEEY